MKHLSVNLKGRANSGDLQRHKIKGVAVDKHLVYVDDVIFLARTTERRLKAMKVALDELYLF